MSIINLHYEQSQVETPYFRPLGNGWGGPKAASQKGLRFSAFMAGLAGRGHLGSLVSSL